MIGLSTGSCAFLLTQCIQLVDGYRKNLLLNHNPFTYVLVCTVGCFFSALLVAVFAPLARGSGMPEVIAYLNGIRCEHVFRFREMSIKFISNIFAVGFGLPMGQEGPMVAFGAALGAGIGRGRFAPLNIRNFCNFSPQFQNSKDLQDFVSGGVAAGVSAAFNAPVGGLLFAMEEVSSFWRAKLTWLIFCACMVYLLP